MEISKSFNTFVALIKICLILMGSISTILCAYFVALSFIRQPIAFAFSFPQINSFSSIFESTASAASSLSNNKWVLESDLNLTHYRSILPNWGSYRPGFYFGLRTRGGISLGTGIAWSNSYRYEYRHQTNTDEISKFEWTRHNGRDYGIENLYDDKNGIKITASFIITENCDTNTISEKIINESGDISLATDEDSTVDLTSHLVWTQRFEIKSEAGAETGTWPFLFYLGQDCVDSFHPEKCSLNGILENVKVFQQSDREMFIVGFSRASGWTCLSLVSEATLPGKITYSGISSRDIYQSSKLLISDLKGERKQAHSPFLTIVGDELNNQVDSSVGFIALHIAIPSNSDSTFLISRLENLPIKSAEEALVIFEARKQLSVEIVNHWNTVATKRESEFQSRFEELSASAGNKVAVPGHSEAVKVALSSLLGGIGYFEGKAVIANEFQDSDQENKTEVDINPTYTSLLTATPSRTSFPRGFLWDEGFHQLVIMNWDIKITISILSDWLNAMYLNVNNKDGLNVTQGWIPREMILGQDSSSRVPDEFIVQRPNIANPPTFLLVIDSLLDKVLVGVSNSREYSLVLSFIRDIYPRLHYWINWFKISQSGLKDGTFRWRGRSISDSKVIPNTLASGLDDYPRSPLPTKEERHVDLHAWLIIAFRVMDKIEKALEGRTEFSLPESSKHLSVQGEYNSQMQKLVSKLDEFHWSNAHKGYFDYGINNESAVFVTEVLCRCVNQEKRIAIDGFIPMSVLQQQSGLQLCPASHPHFLGSMGQSRERLRAANFTLSFIPRIGYVSIFPLILKIVPATSSKLNYILDMIEDPALLWTPFGLRSIASTDKFYLRRNAPGDAPYWRGPIWMNINYLALSALSYYSAQKGPYQTRCSDLYKKLHAALLNNVLKEYIETGFFWEHYDDQTGKGTRGHPFTGWTALVVNIFLEKY